MRPKSAARLLVRAREWSDEGDRSQSVWLTRCPGAPGDRQTGGHRQRGLDAFTRPQSTPRLAPHAGPPLHPHPDAHMLGL